MIAALAGQGYDVKRCCRILGVAPSGYFSWRRRSPSPMELRREWLRGLISSDPRRLARRLRLSAHSRGVAAWPADRRLEEARAQADGRGTAAGTADPQAAQEPRQRRDRRGSRLPRLHPRAPQPAVADRHHRAPDQGGQGLLLRRARRALPPDRRLVDRQPPGVLAGHQRARDGDQQPHPACWDRDPHRPRQPSSPPGRSANASARPASCPRWAPSATPTTTP